MKSIALWLLAVSFATTLGAQSVSISEKSVADLLRAFDASHSTLEQASGLGSYFASRATFVSDILESNEKWAIECVTPQKYIDNTKDFVSRVKSVAVERKDVKTSISEDKTCAAVESRVNRRAVTIDGKTTYEIPEIHRMLIIAEGGSLKIQSLWLSGVAD